MFIMGVICANIFFMMTEHEDQVDGWTTFIDVMNYIFAFIFTVEMIFKIYAMGRRAYFANGWNKFDFVIVMLTLVSMILVWCNVELPFDPTLLR